MQESKDAHFFKKKQKEMEKFQDKYEPVKNWQVGPGAFAKTQAPDYNLTSEKKSRRSKNTLERDVDNKPTNIDLNNSG